MFDVSNSISVHVLQLPNDKNGRTAIVSSSIVMPDGRIVSDVPHLLVLLLKTKILLKSLKTGL